MTMTYLRHLNPTNQVPTILTSTEFLFSCSETTEPTRISELHGPKAHSDT